MLAGEERMTRELDPPEREALDPMEPPPLPEVPSPPAEPAPVPPARSTMPPAWHVLVGYAAAWVGVLGLGGVVALIVIVADDHGLRAGKAPSFSAFMSPTLVLASSAVSALVLGGLALGACALERVDPRTRLGLVGQLPLALLAVAVVGGVSVGQAVESLAHVAGWEGGGMLGLLNAAVQSMGPVQQGLAVLLVGLGAGTCEELFFRGYMQRALSHRFGPWKAVLMASAAFGLMHADPVHTPLAFLMGLYLGWLAELTGSVVPGMVTHAVNNTTFLVLTWLGVGIEGRGTHAVVLALALVVVATVVLALRRGVPAARARSSTTPAA
jgi:membrane protease YdiL (CAAX protease family)